MIPSIAAAPRVIPRVARAAALLVSAALFAACSTSPTSGRAQFNVLPGELETTVPDLRFGVKTLLAAGGEYCAGEETACPAREAAETLARRIAPIAERLGVKAAQLSPEMTFRISRVDVFVVPGDAPTVSSSASGKIAVGAGLGRLALTDTELAFALAREFGRLAAAHHRESTSAGLAVSLIAGSPLTSTYLATSILADIVFPMGALAKIGISLLASMGTEQLVEAAQQDEADEYAGKLLMASGYDPKALGQVRADDPQEGTRSGWLASYFASRARVAASAQPDSWPDEAERALAPPPGHEPWPDDEQYGPPGGATQSVPPPEETAGVKPEAIARTAAPGLPADATAEAPQPPPRAQTANAPGAKKPAGKKNPKKIRKAPRKNPRRH